MLARYSYHSSVANILRMQLNAQTTAARITDTAGGIARTNTLLQLSRGVIRD